MKIEKIPEGYLLARKGGNGCELWRKFNGAESLACDAIDELIAERDALRAKIEAMEKQVPVATVDANDEGYWAEILPDRSVRVGQKLYALPGAQQCRNCNGMGDRFDPSGEKIPCDLCESNLEEIRVLVAEAARDIISGGDFWLSISLAAKKIYALPGAQPAPSVPDGYKLVPIEPTPEMMCALIDGANQYDSWKEGYRDMLAAAPEAKP